jgi:hypothetical protein
MSGNAWADKAHQLDRYRWQLLRERHGLAGSLLRFLRDAIIETAYGLAAKLRLAISLDSSPCDFLLLQSSPRVILLQRKKAFMMALQARGHSLSETALPEMHDLIAGRMLRRPLQHVPLRYFPYAAHAMWLVEKYRPRILLNDRNGSLYSPFLRLALNSQRSLIVHLAHSTTVEASRRLGMNDYDYYFLFGRSSLEALQARKLRYGTSTAVLAGSHMIDDSYALPPPAPGLKTVLVLGLGPDKEKVSGYQATYQLLRDWAERHPEYRMLIKKHPRSYMEFWETAEHQLGNVHVLPRASTLAEALGQASIVVNIVSNAVIEATLAQRPILFVNCGNDSDILSQARFFGGKISTMEMLEHGMDALQQNYLDSCRRSADFAEYHLAFGIQGMRQTIDDLERLLAGDAPQACTEVVENTI